MSKSLKYILPFAVLAMGIIGAGALVKSRKEVEKKATVVPPPLVRVMTVQSRPVQLTIKSQGKVTPRTESNLVAQVAGQVIDVAPGFASGGFFKKGDVLLQIDPRDYELVVDRAKARIAQARLRMLQVEEEAALAREEWSRIGAGKASDLTLHKPQVEEARANMASAEADLKQAELNLERTGLRAPFDGRVLGKNADMGQYVTQGAAVARIYAIDYAEIRLPLTDKQLSLIDMEFDFRDERHARRGPEVLFSADFLGKMQKWTGHISRLEGEIDPLTQLAYVVAQVDDPYGRHTKGNRPPLTANLFVKAEIEGIKLEKAVSLPRAAIRRQNQVWVITPENRLTTRTIRIEYADSESVVVTAGLKDGEMVCLSPLDVVTEGMPVRLTGAGKAPAENKGGRHE